MTNKVLIKVKNIWDEDIYINEIRKIGLKIEDIKKRSTLMGFTESASDSFIMVSIILWIIGTIIAGVTIFIIIYVNVVNKRRQIGILKAIGMKETTIVISFVIQALFYSIVWIILGAISVLFILGPILIMNPLDFPMGWVSLGVTFDIIKISNISLILASFIGGFVPAYSWAKKSILHLIRW